MTAEQDATGAQLSRRTFVLRAMAVIAAGVTAALAIPMVGFATVPGWRVKTPIRVLSTSVSPTLRSDDWTSVGKMTDFEVGVPRYMEVVRHVTDGWVEENVPIGVHVVRQSDTDVRVFDPHCTHLGCPLAWSSGSGAFVCPCHGGSFTAVGEVVSGPPPRPMFRYETRIDGDEIFIGPMEGV